MASVLFKKQDTDLKISVGNLNLTVNLNEVSINNDQLTIFFTELVSYFVDEDFKYVVEPADSERDEKVILFVKLVKNFIETYKKEFDRLKLEYAKEVSDISTKLSQ